jgi:hypothetical protein
MLKHPAETALTKESKRLNKAAEQLGVTRFMFGSSPESVYVETDWSLMCRMYLAHFDYCRPDISIHAWYENDMYGQEVTIQVAAPSHGIQTSFIRKTAIKWC